MSSKKHKKKKKRSGRRGRPQQMSDFNHLHQTRDARGHFVKVAKPGDVTPILQPTIQTVEVADRFGVRAGGKEVGLSFEDPKPSSPVNLPGVMDWGHDDPRPYTPPKEEFRPDRLEQCKFMPIVWSWGWFEVISTKIYGGPYRNKPVDVLGVKMAEEIHLPCFIGVPTRDFSVPDVRLMREGLEDGVVAIMQGKKLYAGCMGGTGRTGLYLALVAKAFGLEAEAHGRKGPVGYVRKHYKAHAVETSEQQKYIDDFDVSSAKKLIKKYALAAFARRIFFLDPGRPSATVKVR